MKVLGPRSLSCIAERIETFISSVTVRNIIPLRYAVSGRIGKVVASRAAVARSSPAEVALIYLYSRGSQGVLPMRVGGATRQLDLPFPTPLSVAGCG